MPYSSKFTSCCRICIVAINFYFLASFLRNVSCDEKNKEKREVEAPNPGFLLDSNFFNVISLFLLDNSCNIITSALQC